MLTELSPDDYELLVHMRVAERDAIAARRATERYIAQKYALQSGDSVAQDRTIVRATTPNGVTT